MPPKSKASKQITPANAKNTKHTPGQTPGGTRRGTRTTPATDATASRQLRGRAIASPAAEGKFTSKKSREEPVSDDEVPVGAAAAALAAAAITSLANDGGAGPSKPPPPRAKSTRETPSKPTASKPAAKLALEMAMEKWAALPDNKKTPAKAIIITADACRRAVKLSNRACYIGSVKISKEVPEIPQAILEIYRTLRASGGAAISEAALINNLTAEYGTNISWVKGIMSLVTGKYTGIEFSGAFESVILTISKPSGALVDFLFNCAKLSLCSFKEIEQFVSKDSWKGARAYILPDAEVLKLVHSGIHEKFRAKEIIDKCIVVQECVKVIDNMPAAVQNIQWAELEEGGGESEEKLEDLEEYYAGDGDIESDDEATEYEKDDEGEDSSDNE